MCEGERVGGGRGGSEAVVLLSSQGNQHLDEVKPWSLFKSVRGGERERERVCVCVCVCLFPIETPSLNPF